MTRDNIVVNVLTGEVGRIIERYSPNFNPYYADFRVLFGDGKTWVIKQRHLRHAMFGEKLEYNSQQHKKKTA